MNVEYALFTLKQKKDFLENKIKDLDNGNEKDIHGELNVKRFQTKLKHQIGELQFAIELLEEWVEE